MNYQFEKKIKLLKDYFSKRPEILMAFVFGSRVKKTARKDSDWDIAVYFKKTEMKVGPKEWEPYYPAEDEILGDCIEMLQTDNVDLIVLNRASPSIADAALRGTPLLIRDRRLWLRFLLSVTNESIDFRRMSQEYAEIYWRSASLNPQDAEELNKRLIFIDSELSALSEYAATAQSEYQNDHKTRRIIERTIENLMNAVIDVSKIVLASQKRPIPDTYREIIEQTGLFKPFSPNATQKLAQWAGLRNILAHEYLDYRWRSVSDFLKNSEQIFKEFIKSSRQFVDNNQTAKRGG